MLQTLLQTAVYIAALRRAAYQDAANNFGWDSSEGATDPSRFGPTQPPNASSKLQTTSHLGARIYNDNEHWRVQA